MCFSWAVRICVELVMKTIKFSEVVREKQRDLPARSCQHSQGHCSSSHL